MPISQARRSSDPHAQAMRADGPEPIDVDTIMILDAEGGPICVQCTCSTWTPCELEAGPCGWLWIYDDGLGLCDNPRCSLALRPPEVYL